MNPERQRLHDYCRRNGLAIENVQAGTWDEDGFYAYNPITGRLSEKIDWPPSLNYDWFCKLAEVADLADYRRAGIRVPHVVD